MNRPPFSVTTFDTALGRLAIAFSDEALLAVALPAQTEAATARHASREARKLASRQGARRAQAVTVDAAGPLPPHAREAIDRLTRHLGGERVDLAALPLEDGALTDFRRAVYRAARSIGWGEVRTYAELAEQAGSPDAARAVGRAMATNPWPIIVPCHRVLATSSSAARRIGGFSSPGGTRTKAALLALEGVSVDDADRKTASTQQRLDF